MILTEYRMEIIVTHYNIVFIVLYNNKKKGYGNQGPILLVIYIKSFRCKARESADYNISSLLL